MKLIISSIFLFLLLTLTVLADISQVQLDKYKEVSIIDETFEKNSEILLQRVLVFYGNKTIENKIEAKNFIYDKKYSSIYFEVFRHFDTEDYKKIMTLYKSDIGQKYVNAEKRVLALGSKKKIRKTFLNIHINKKKMELINLIIQSNRLIELKMKHAIKYFEIYNNGLPMKMQKSQEEMDIQITKYRDAMVEYQKGLSKLIYHDFSTKELKVLLEFSRSKAGKNENNLKFKAEYIYMKTIMNDFMIFINKFF